MPEMLVLSGLDDVGQEQKEASTSGLLWGIGTLAALYAIGFIASKFSGQRTAADLSGLGIIKRCRKNDLTSKKSKSKQRWCLWTKSESRILGRHPSKSRAIKQERLIEMKKHGIPTRR